MNITEIQQFVQAIQGLGDNAQSAFYAWLLYKAFDSLLSFTCVMICIFLARKGLVWMARNNKF